MSPFYKFICVVLGFSLVISPARMQQAQSSQENQPLEGRALENVVAFTRLLGYVSLFYPGDVAAETDWEVFTYRFITEVEQAEDAEALAASLTALFTPFAPTIQVFPSGNAPEALPLPDVETGDDLTSVQWVRPGTVDPTSPTGELLPPERVHIAFEAGTLPAVFTDDVSFGQGRALEIPVNDPTKPLEVELGGGVSARIPLAVYADAVGTLPHIESPEMQEGSPGKRASRLGVVALFWNHFQHLFSYWDVLENQGVDWEDALREALVAASLNDDPEAFLMTLRRLTAHLKDGHTTVYSAAFSAARVAEAVPGFQWDMIEGQLTITTVTPDYAGQLQPGDVVTEIDGRPTEIVLAEKAELIGGTDQFVTFMALYELLTGALNSEIELLVQPFDGGEVFRTLETRSRRMGDNIYGSIKEVRPPVMAELSPGIIYLDITRLHQTELPVIIPVLAEAEGLVLDYRGYTRQSHPVTLLGHLADAPGKTTPFLLPFFTRPDHQDITYLDFTGDWVVPQQPRLTENVAWIVNANNTISYAESVLGIVERGGFGELVGTPTAGANGNVAFARFLGYEVRYTSLRIDKFDGSPLFTVGVTPTVHADRTRAGVAAGRDELLEAAFRAVGGQTLNIKPIEIGS